MRNKGFERHMPVMREERHEEVSVEGEGMEIGRVPGGQGAGKGCGEGHLEGLDLGTMSSIAEGSCVRQDVARDGRERERERERGF